MSANPNPADLYTVLDALEDLPLGGTIRVKTVRKLLRRCVTASRPGARAAKVEERILQEMTLAMWALRATGGSRGPRAGPGITDRELVILTRRLHLEVDPFCPECGRSAAAPAPAPSGPGRQRKAAIPAPPSELELIARRILHRRGR